MVAYKDILASNALISDATAPRVAVFVGGTSGIGRLTALALAATGAGVRIYLVGRASAAARAHALASELRAASPRAEVVWVEGEVALLAEARRVCGVIRAREASVDLLFLSAGYAPFGARRETAEGVEVAQSLEYYGRVLFVRQLLPLLRAADAPRVVSVLGGGLERASVNVDDPGLRAPGSFGSVAAQAQYVTMNTVALERLADDNPGVTFVHSWPGWVNTGNVRRGLDPDSTVMRWVVSLVLEPLIRLFSLGHDESAQRHLFQITSAAFGGRGTPWGGKPGTNSRLQHGNGLFLVNYKCDCTPNAKVMPLLREKATAKIWSHTEDVLRPYL
ncbi:putative short chain dehydrogenase reductase family protein [Rosellinia necatrix]|uniref:Putative short chain dehydrogenase reductase family protein n=1 Tax=Rosellinia necatrix TaxID=77044 RepID=A0A1W2TK72_ROSNE|nr:putative short chain dehydrogenase reductase family protein [Rosellinia necatrix]